MKKNDSLFSKRHVLSVASASAAALMFSVGAFGAAQNSYIGAEAAKQKAASHAGVSTANATYWQVEMDREHGQIVYEIEFYVGTTEYDYDINATTGAVVKFSTETHNVPSINLNTNNTATTTSNYIGQERAKEIALAQSGLSMADLVEMKVKLDYENGSVYYEVELDTYNKEYKYYINPTTGAVLYGNSKNEYNNAYGGTQSSGQGRIGLQQAQNIALQHANTSINSIWDLDVELDDSGLYYEVDWESGYWEYEYKIDAYSGAVLKVEIDD